ncbi:hypothetical protein [Sphingomonas montana]|uniref:hypothetical protein n=1 Tax=Sphingomonas montana TaxID=1843236 RepID=UPI00101AD2CE|nr:hypothetical protein [Sphingomonas montana]
MTTRPEARAGTRTTARRMIDAIERTPLALPMALVTAAAAAFLAYAVPAALVARGVVASGIAPLIARATPFGTGPRAVLMLAAAIVAGGAVWWLFHRLEQPQQPVAEDPDIDLFAPEEVVAPAPAPAPDPASAPAPAPQLRRADAHPDAPARRPLFAASDLGAPLDDVDGGFADRPFGRPPLFATTPVEADGADVLLLDERYVSVEATPVVALRDAVDPDRTESIAELMARLERGLERRGGNAAGGARADVPDGHFRQALDELRRMTTGR